MSNNLYGRMSDMLVKLKASNDHPVWSGSLEQMGQYISQALKIHTATGQRIDDDYVKRLEFYMPKPRKRDISERLDKIEARLAELEKHSHKPQEIHPRVVAAMGCEEVKALIREALK